MSTPPNVCHHDGRRRMVVVCVVLFVGTFLLFSRAIGHGFLDLDDPDYVTQNRHVQGGFTWQDVRWAFTTGDAANWHPLTWMSHMLDWRLYGNHPGGHHATSILWHSLNAVMALIALRRLTGAFWPSAMCAALFAWHPLRVESVAWISERKDVLSVFFGLLTIWAYAVYAQRRRESKCGAGGFYLIAMASLAVGLMCKPTLVTLPCLLLLLDLWPLQRLTLPSISQSAGRLLVEKIPFFLLAVASSIVTYRVQKAGGAVIGTLTLQSRLANSAVSFVAYLRNFFWPFHLAMGYPNPDHWPLPTVMGSVVLLAFITIVGLWQWRKRPWILVGWLWFLGTLVPMIGIVKVGLQGMADRYTYFPMLGVEIAIVWTLAEIKISARWVPAAAATLVLAVCAALTWRQLGIWQTPRSLYEYSVAATADNYLAECYLGSNLLGEKRYDDAMAHFQRAIAIKPDYALARLRRCLILQKLGRRDEAEAEYRDVLRTRPNDAQAHYGLGLLLSDANRPLEAIDQLQVALELQPEDEGTLLRMGRAQAQAGHADHSIACYEKVIALFPDHAEPYFDYADSLVLLHRDAEAIAQYEKSEKLDPQSEEAFVNEANSLRKLGRLEDAAVRDRQAIELKPDDADAYFGLASALDDLQRTDEAKLNYEKAVALRPAFPDAQYNLGVILMNANQPQEAMAHFKAAVDAQPENSAAFLGLGMACAQIGQPAQAVTYLKQAVSLDPNNADAHFLLGQTLDSLGERAPAIEELETVSRLNPNYSGLNELLSHVRGETPASAPSTQP